MLSCFQPCMHAHILCGPMGSLASGAVVVSYTSQPYISNCCMLDTAAFPLHFTQKHQLIGNATG